MILLLICLSVAWLVLMVGIVDPCGLDVIRTGSACIDQLSHDEKLATLVFYKCAELAACSGGTCTVTQLMTDVACLKELDDNRLESAAVYSALLSANVAGASLSSSMQTIQDGIKCLKLIDAHTLRALIVLLDCKLRQCVTGPIIL